MKTCLAPAITRGASGLLEGDPRFLLSPQSCKKENPFSFISGRVKKKGGKGKPSVVSGFFFSYYEKELGTIATNKQTWHLALLHLYLGLFLFSSLHTHSLLTALGSQPRWIAREGGDFLGLGTLLHWKDSRLVFLGNTGHIHAGTSGGSKEGRTLA